MTSAHRLVAASVALVLALLLAPAAAARKFQMSGTWVWRTGTVFLPLQFIAGGMDMTGNIIHASQGNLTGAFLFPNGPIPGAGGVIATGSAPATLRISPHRFVENAMALIPLNGITLVQITTKAIAFGPYSSWAAR